MRAPAPAITIHAMSQTAPTNELLPAELLDAPIAGVGLTGATLRAELGDELVLLVFLRHFG